MSNIQQNLFYFWLLNLKKKQKNNYYQPLLFVQQKIYLLFWNDLLANGGEVAHFIISGSLTLESKTQITLNNEVARKSCGGGNWPMSHLQTVESYFSSSTLN